MSDEAETTKEVIEDAPEPQQARAEPVAQPVTATPPVQQRQTVQHNIPQFVTPAQITRARETAARLDEQLGAGGALKTLIEDVTGVSEETARENFGLRNTVQAQGRNLNVISAWQEHDGDPQFKDYPSTVARADYVKVRQEVENDPHYQGADPAFIDVAARERFYAQARNRQSTPPAATGAANNTPEPVVRQVGATRVVPRGVKPAAPVPQRKLTVQESLERGEIPSGFTPQQIEAEFSQQ